MEDTAAILHVSDTHLGFRQYALVERERDIYEVFGEVIDIAIKEHVDIVIHSGDFFDSVNPPPQAYYHAIPHLSRLREKGIPLLVVPGDHDIPKRRVIPPLLVLERLGLVKVVGLREPEKIQVRARGKKVIVAGYRNMKGPGARQRILEAFKKLSLGRSEAPSILMLHQTLRNVAPEYEIELGELPKNYSYYAMGHIHLFKTFRLGESAVVYPGSPEALRLDEAEAQSERYIVLAEIGASKTISINKVRLTSPRPQLVRRHIFSDDKALASFLVSLREEVMKIASFGKKPLLHIIVERVPRGKKQQIYSKIEQLLRDYVLALRLRISTIDTRLPHPVQQSTSAINLYEILKEVLGSDEEAKLALDLIDALSIEPKQAALRQAEEIIKKYFGVEV
ncbi:metallophosphoesterase family protein [Pyrofollis japonicus]|uniref:metallophosphoesterase family protein n=1 Tax=Pyrofollis japonicus TaxID=3060460 RepID=UPI00295AF91F|nr:DNA repair exonuclease [Pyrofollis japonicus]